MPIDRPSLPALLLTAAATLLLALSAVHFSVHTGDDGFIFLRYAERFAAGRGLGFTDGVPALEGYSSPIWVLLLTGLVGLGVPSMWAAKLLSVASLGGLLAATWALVRALGGRPVQAAGALLGLALLRPPMFWGFSGLETPLAGAVLCWAAWGLARGEGRWAIPAGLLAWVRPEGPVMAVGVVMLGAFRERRLPSIPALATALAPGIVLVGLRLALYGDVLPNTFYAKANSPLIPQLTAGLGYAGLLLPALIATALAAWLARGEDGRQADRWLAPVGLALLQLLIVIGGGGDWMWFGRLLVPVLPIAVAVGVSLLGLPLLPRVLAIIGLMGLLPWATPPLDWLDAARLRPLPTVAWQEGQMTPAEAAAGAWIAAHGEPGDLVAVNHAGAMPWAAPDQRILDMTGLLDAHIARTSEGGLHAKYDVDYVLAAEPDWVVLHTRSAPTAAGGIVTADYWVGETALFEDPRFQATYQPTGAVFPWDWVAAARSYTVVYRRGD